MLDFLLAQNVHSGGCIGKSSATARAGLAARCRAAAAHFSVAEIAAAGGARVNGFAHVAGHAQFGHVKAGHFVVGDDAAAD